MKVDIENKKSVCVQLKDYTYYNSNESLEVTEWANGEGWDITIGNRSFQLHCEELDLIVFLTRYLDYESKEKV